MHARRTRLWIVIGVVVAVLLLLLYLGSQSLQPGRGSSSQPATVR